MDDSSANESLFAHRLGGVCQDVIPGGMHGVGVGKHSPHRSGVLFVPPHGLQPKRKADIVTLKGHSRQTRQSCEQQQKQ